MVKGQERPSREKKKQKKDKASKTPSAYASQYGNQPTRIAEPTPGKKQ